MGQIMERKCLLTGGRRKQSIGVFYNANAMWTVWLGKSRDLGRELIGKF